MSLTQYRFLFASFVFVAMAASPAVANPGRAPECSNARVVVNYKNETTKEGLLKVFHLLSDQVGRYAFILQLPPFNEQTGERMPHDETVKIQFKTPFPNATEEQKEAASNRVNEIAKELAKIDGVRVSCIQVSSPQPRMSGGF